MRYSRLIVREKRVRVKNNNIVESDGKKAILSSQKKKDGWLRALSIPIVSTFYSYQFKKIIFVTNDQSIIIKETVTT